MSRLRLVPALAVFATLTVLGSTAHASFPAGVWGLVEKVTFEPDMKAPTMVRIDGLFIVANQKPDFGAYPGYGEPQAGYMYYKCDAKTLAMCVMEWQELAAVVGSENNCRGWGDSSLPDNGSVRDAPQPPLNPDGYPIAMGVLMGFSPCQALQAWEVPVPGTTGGGESEGTSDTSAGTETGTGGSTSTTTGESGTTHATHSGSEATGSEATEPPQTGGDTDGGNNETANVGTEGGGLTSGPTEGSTGAGATTAAGASESGASGAESGTPADDDKGCACNSAGDPARQLPAALMTLLGLGLLRRRRT